MKKLAILLSCALLVGAADLLAKPSERPSSSSSKSSGSSSKPTTSKPSTSTPSSRPSSRPDPKPTPSTRPSSKPESKPTFESKPTVKPSSKPTTNVDSGASAARKKEESRNTFQNTFKPTPPPTPTVSTTPSTSPSAPSVRPSSRPNSPQPPPTATTSKPTTSKPTTTVDASASSARRKEESRAVFQKANPKPEPAPTYTANGRTEKVNTQSAKVIRETVTPDEYASRPQRIEKHYYHHYGDRYYDYNQRPTIYVGGGYSSLFWYSMMDWDYQRRALWLYNHQHEIDRSLYQQQLQNAQLKAELARLQQQGADPNPGYIDPEFKTDPDAMYSDEYVKAAYNPQEDSHTGLIVILLITGVVVIGAIIWYVAVRQVPGT